MDDRFVERVTQAVEDAAKYCTECIEHAAKNVASRYEVAAGHSHNLVDSIRREKASDDVELGGLRSSIVASCKKVPSGGWFLLSLAMGGILIARGPKKKCGRTLHPSICHCIQLQPPAFYFDQPLKNQNFCAQDIFDVEAAITSFGSPHWEKTHEAATKTAPVLETLKNRGATCIGKTVMDELGFSLLGKNRWLETPKNPSALYRISGGSSSGAAVSVASDIASFAIGVDTVGDVRVPAACCGVLGFRASHGAVSMAGVIPVASSCDAIGWFARNAGLLLLVGRQLCTPHSEADSSGPKGFYIAQDLFKISCLPLSRTADVLSRSIHRTVGRLSLHDIELLDYFNQNIPAIQTFKEELNRMGIQCSQYTALDVLRESMLLFHRYEFKSNHGEWIAKLKPQLTCTVETRVQRAVFTPSSEALRLVAVKVRDELRTLMDFLLKDDVVLLVPALPSLPPKLDAPANELEHFEYETHALMSIATLSGCCQVVIPVGTYGCPMAVSLLARKGSDLLLLDTTFLLHTTVQQEVLLTADPNISIAAFIHQIR